MNSSHYTIACCVQSNATDPLFFDITIILFFPLWGVTWKFDYRLTWWTSTHFIFGEGTVEIFIALLLARFRKIEKHHSRGRARTFSGKICKNRKGASRGLN
jgi:hypothetical protein